MYIQVIIQICEPHAGHYGRASIYMFAFSTALLLSRGAKILYITTSVNTACGVNTENEHDTIYMRREKNANQ
jgi:hypothetical protein